MRTLSLAEFCTTRLSEHLLSDEEGFLLADRYGRWLDVDFPSRRNARSWEITPQGVCGTFLVGDSLQVEIAPKVPIANLAGMLGVANDLDVEVLPGLGSCASVADFYEQLVRLLVAEVNGIIQRGPHRSYRPEEGSLTVVRGRVLADRWIRRPTPARIPCRFQELTGNVLENQVLVWTLERVLQTALLSDPTTRAVRNAHRHLAGITDSVEVTAAGCRAIRYSRLTEQYTRAHAVCALLLDGMTPQGSAGETSSVPFILDMARLFEHFVARWLSDNLPERFALIDQHRFTVGDSAGVQFSIDLLIRERATGRPLCVLDTKYVDVKRPKAGHLEQVGYYALAVKASSAGLIYPIGSTGEWTGTAGTVRQFRTTFDLSRPIADAGAVFMRDLIQRLDFVSASDVEAGYPGAMASG